MLGPLVVTLTVCEVLRHGHLKYPNISLDWILVLLDPGGCTTSEKELHCQWLLSIIPFETVTRKCFPVFPVNVVLKELRNLLRASIKAFQHL